MSCTVTTVATGEPIGIIPFVKCAMSGRSAPSALAARSCIHPIRTGKRWPSCTRTCAGSGDCVSIGLFDTTTISSPVLTTSRARCCSRCSV